MPSKKLEPKTILYIFIAMITVVVFLAVIIIGIVLLNIFTITPSQKPETISQPIESSQKASNVLPGKRQVKNPTTNFLTLPDGFVVEVFADNLGGSSISTPGPNSGPRMMIEYNDGILVSVMKKGYIEALSDSNHDGHVEKRTIFIEGLDNPHGLAVHDGWVYIAQEKSVFRVRDDDKNNQADDGSKQDLIDLSDTTGGHFTRTIKVFDNKLYLTIGSTCNACKESNEKNASMLECDLDGRSCIEYASGLRNTVDFIQYEGKIYGTENGRDQIGNDIPPDEINSIEKGKNYGWPFCYGKAIYDETTGFENICNETEPSFIDLQAHVAALGIDVYQSNIFPDEYNNTFFVALHGSWNRNPPSGYKIININPETKNVQDFATGFLDEGTVKGRPMGVLEYDGALLVSDDNAGRIYRIVYEN